MLDDRHDGRQNPTPRIRYGVDARLLQRLAADGAVDVAAIAREADISTDAVDACRSGATRLPPDARMRLAAVVVARVPRLARLAHTLHAQAEAELRYQAHAVVSHRSYPGPEVVRGIRATAGDADAAGVARHDLSVRSAAALDDARALGERHQHLIRTAASLVADRRALRASSVALLERDVSALARALRASDTPPERALVLVKRAVEPMLAAVPDARQQMLDEVVRWFVDSYYAA